MTRLFDFVVALLLGFMLCCVLAVYSDADPATKSWCQVTTGNSVSEKYCVLKYTIKS